MKVAWVVAAVCASCGIWGTTRVSLFFAVRPATTHQHLRADMHLSLYMNIYIEREEKERKKKRKIVFPRLLSHHDGSTKSKALGTVPHRRPRTGDDARGRRGRPGGWATYTVLSHGMAPSPGQLHHL